MTYNRNIILILAALVLCLFVLACSSDSGTTDGDATDGDLSDAVDNDIDSDNDSIDGDLPTEIEQDIDADEDDLDQVEDGDTELDLPDSEVDELVSDGDEEADTDTEEDIEQDTIEQDIIDVDELEAEFDEEEIEALFCKVDFLSVGDQLPYNESHTTQTDDNSINADCFDWDVNGVDVVYELTLDETKLINVTVDPADNDADLAVYLVDSCDMDAACLFAADANLDGLAESLTFRVGGSGTYYLVVDSKSETDESPYDITISVVQPGMGVLADACSSDSECWVSAVEGSGHCVGEGFYKACSMLCENDADCTNNNFNSGCCLEVPALSGSYCHYASLCGDDGMTAQAGELCAVNSDPNQPTCERDQEAVPCIDNTPHDTQYCSKFCDVDSDCSSFSTGCCVDAGLSEDICLFEDDCKQFCDGADVILLNSSAFPSTSKSTLAGKSNSVNAFGCIQDGTPGRDQVYKMLIPEGQTVEVTLSTEGTWDGVLYFSDKCGFLDSADDCFVIANDSPANEDEVLRFAPSEGGWYWLMLDSVTYESGSSYELHFEFVEDSEPETTDGDEEVELEEADIELGECVVDFTYSRDALPLTLTNHSNYQRGNYIFSNTECSGAAATPAPETIYAVDLLTGDTLSVDLINISNFNPTVAIYSDCSDVACLEFHDDVLAGSAEQFDFAVTSDGTYYVVVDSSDIDGIGSYNLSLSITPDIDGDIDELEIEIEVEIATCDPDNIIYFLPYLNTGSTYTETSDVNATSTVDNGCASWSLLGPEHVYQVTLAAGETIDVTVINNKEFTVGVDFAVIITEAECALMVDCLEGANNTVAEGDEQILGFTSASGGMYYIIIDSPNLGNGGSYSLTVETPAG